MAALKRAGIIFDFDDTLVCSHEVFLDIQQQFCLRMQKLGLADDNLLRELEARDIANVQAKGYMAAECFPLALQQTYQNYCQKYGQAIIEQEKEEIAGLGWQVYNLQPRLMPGARQLLANLRRNNSNYPLFLFTQGEPAIQGRRIENSGLAEFFAGIKIVSHKNIATLQHLLAEQHLDTATTWYVGNSLRADINPAIEAGLKAVHLNIKAWSYEHQTPCGEYYTIECLAQFADLLAQNMEAAR